MLVEKIKPASFDFTSPRRKDLYAPFIARRQQQMDFTASTRMHFLPTGQESAGMALVQQMNHQYHFERVCEDGKGYLRVVLCREKFSSRPYLPGFTSETMCELIAKVPYEQESVLLTIEGHGREYRFLYGTSAEDMTQIAEGDAALISTEQIGCMTGTMIGVYASGNGKDVDNQAAFDWSELI